MCAGFIHQRRAENLLQCFLSGCYVSACSGIKHIALVRIEILRRAVIAVVEVLRPRRKTALMFQQVTDGELRFPVLVGLERNRIKAVIFDVDRFFRKCLAEDINNSGVQVDLAPGQKILEGIVHTVHLCVRRKVIKRFGRDGCCFDRTPFFVISPDVAPGIFIDKTSVFHNGKLSARKAVFDVGGDDPVNGLQCVFRQPDVFQFSFHHRWIRNADTDRSFFDIADLQRVQSVHRECGNVQLIRGPGDGVFRGNARSVDIKRECAAVLIRLKIQHALSGIAIEADPVVDGKRRVDAALPVGECNIKLPLPGRDL